MNRVPSGLSEMNGAASQRRARIPLLDRDEMSLDQRDVFDSVAAGPRGRMIGPLLAALHSPELAKLWSRFGEYLRFRTCLPKSLNELAILVCGRSWNSQVEWWVHARVAQDVGLSSSIVEAIHDCRSPIFSSEAELEVYEFARLLQQTGQVPRDLHEAVKQRWGVRGVVELTAVIGYYTMVAMTLNAHDIPVPDDAEPPFSARDSRPSLPSGRLAS